MNPDDLIESYVNDVAVQLPRTQRNDVAFELTALLKEELDAKASASGRDVDEAMALEFLNAFGRPADVAARYRPTLTIIDPADGHAFLQATVIGLAIAWAAGLLQVLQQSPDSTFDLLTALGRWWTGTVLLSLWWPGLLVVCFGIASWTRRRWPQSAAWKPRGVSRPPGRVALALGVAGILGGLFILFNPRWVLEVFYGGRAAPAAYEALTYTESFRHRQGPWLFALVLLNIPMLVPAIVAGRKSSIMQRVEFELGLVTCVVLTWTVLDGPIFLAASGDQMAKGLITLITVVMLIRFGVKLHRTVRPAPSR
jgi:hypothetical protein